MATPIADMPVEVTQDDLETRYLELADMAIRHVHDHALRVFS